MISNVIFVSVFYLYDAAHFFRQKNSFAKDFGEFSLLQSRHSGKRRRFILVQIFLLFFLSQEDLKQNTRKNNFLMAYLSSPMLALATAASAMTNDCDLSPATSFLKSPMSTILF